MSYTATAQITINAPSAQVWEALITPDIIKKYMFGSTAESEWQEGSAITYSGEWDGKPYQDKGEILEIRPQEILRTTHFNPLSGDEDVPENYHIVTWQLVEDNGQTTVALTQENNKTQDEADRSAANWRLVLAELKRLLEVA